MEPQSNFPQSSELLYHPKHHIKVYVWIALVVAAVLVALNGYIYFLRLSYLEQGAKTAQENEQSIQELRAQRSDTSDWKTYRNEEYGFEFKYPENFILEEYDASEIKGPDKSGLPADYHYISVSNIDEWFNNECGFDDEPCNKLFIITMAFNKTDLSRDPKEIFSMTKGNLVTAEADKIYDQILSTFKFIDTQGMGTLSGKVSIGPNCPVEREGVTCTPSPEAYASRIFIVLDSNQKEVTRFHADVNGNYIVTLSAGTYTVESVNKGMGYMSADLPATVTIKTGQTVALNIDIDTGIR